MKYPLIQSVYGGFLSVLYGFYTLEYEFLLGISQRIYSFELEEAIEGRKICSAFMINTQNLISFINSHQFMKGFQVKKGEFELFQPKNMLLQSFDDYIEALKKKRGDNKKITSLNHIEGDLIEVLEENMECDIIESEKDLGMQRKQVNLLFLNKIPL